MIIAIDGPAGAGKSTIARGLGKELGLFFLDTGAMYRAVANEVLRAGVDPTQAQAVAALARDMQLRFGEQNSLVVNGREVSSEIRRDAIDSIVSVVAAHPDVRRAIVPTQKQVAGRHGGVVAEGRDVTTVVFSDADFRFYLDASPGERARRRAQQRGTPERLEAILASIKARDAIDSGREDSPLYLAEGVQQIDTDGLTASQVIAKLLAIVRAGGGSER